MSTETELTPEEVVANLEAKQKLEAAKSIFDNRRGINSFVKEYTIHELISSKKIIDDIVEKHEAEQAKLALIKENEGAALEKAAEAYVAAMKAANIDVSLDEAKAKLSGAVAEVESETKTTKTRKPRGEAKKWKLSVGCEIVEKALQGRKSQDILDELQAQGYSETWQLIAKEDQSDFIKYAEEAVSYKDKVEEIKAHFAKGSKKK